MSRRFLLIAAASGLAWAAAAPANDGTATTGASSLVLRQTADIDMVSRDWRPTADLHVLIVQPAI